MALFVLDSSVLIDLERGELLELAFKCGMVMLVPDLLFENELRDNNGPYLVKLGLGVTTLTPEELQQAQDLQAARPPLSLEDCFALICACRPDHILLAGDGPLRRECANRNITCRGVLWFLDQMLAAGGASRATLCEGLNKIANHHRSRLPKQEVQLRLRSWCN